MLVHADLSNCLRRELDQAGWEVLREQANREIKKSRCTAEKIIEVRRQPRAGRKLSEWSREQGVSMASTCARKSKYAGLAVSQLKRLKELEAENRWRKTLVADTSLDKEARKSVIENNGWSR